MKKKFTLNTTLSYQIPVDPLKISRGHTKYVEIFVRIIFFENSLKFDHFPYWRDHSKFFFCGFSFASPF